MLDRVEDAWVRRVVARHFAASAVRVGARARRVTIEACRAEKPVSEPGGYRRQNFLVEGQQVLVRQCASEQGMNDFASGLLAGGPNVFLDSTAQGALGPSGSFESWASGVLYERVKIEGAGQHAGARRRMDGCQFGAMELRRRFDGSARSGWSGERSGAIGRAALRNAIGETNRSQARAGAGLD